MPTQTVRPPMVNKIAADALKIDGFMQASGGGMQSQIAKSNWHTGICHCYLEDGGCPFCCLACCCPCVAYGMNYSLMVAQDSCKLKYCCSPCCLFATLEVIEAAIEVSQNMSNNGDYGNISGLAQFFMISHHRYTVGTSAGIYTVDNCNTRCTICCETMFCAPCVQAQIRNEVLYQRIQNSSGFGFKQQPNTCCAICCCANDCGCAGCVDSMK